ncbi:MAG: hypothetical protein ACREQ5_00985 [Candidatus Dormibacteria bacterium]
MGSGARDGVAAVFAAIASLAIIAIIVVGGWQAGWWFHTQDTNRQAVLDKQGYGYQQPLQTQIGADIDTVTDLNTQLVAANGNPDLITVLATQRRQAVTHICQQAAQINPNLPLASDQAQFVATNCYAGGIAPNSAYR